MRRPHTISLDDFKGYRIETQLASSSSEKKRLTVNVSLDGLAEFKVTGGPVASCHKTLAEAIRAYNEL